MFDDLSENPQAVWSQLYLAGYLTTDDVAYPADAVVPRELRAPNLEVGRLYQRELLERASRVAGGFGQLPFEGSRRAR